MMTDVQHIFTCSKGHLYWFFFVWYVLTMSILCLFTMFIDMLLWFSCFLLTFKCSIHLKLVQLYSLKYRYNFVLFFQFTTK